MQKLILAALAVFAFGAAAADDDFALVTCDIRTLADAQKCMDREAAKQQDYEEPNNGFASNQPEKLVELMTVFGFKKQYIDKARNADFVGGMVVHMDEHHIVYYIMSKGKNVRPEILWDQNIVDIGSELEDVAELPETDLFFIGYKNGDDFDVYSDIEERLDEVRSEREQNEGEPAALEYTKLKCWDTYSRKGSPPLFTAKIVANNQIEVLEFKARENGFSSNLDKPEGVLEGEIITSNRSPYKGNQEFDFAGSRLILPPALDNPSLVEIKKKGIGMGPDENGVIIGSFKGGGDGAGDHISVRLSCRSYAN